VANHAHKKVGSNADLLDMEASRRFRDGGVSIISWEENSVADGLARAGVRMIRNGLRGWVKGGRRRMGSECSGAIGVVIVSIYISKYST